MTIRLEFDSIEDLHAFLNTAQRQQIASLLSRIERLEAKQLPESYQKCGCDSDDCAYDSAGLDLTAQIDYTRGQIGRNAAECGIEVTKPSDILVIRHVVDNWLEYALVMLKKDASGVSTYNIQSQIHIDRPHLPPAQSSHMGDMVCEQPIISISCANIVEYAEPMKSMIRNDLAFLLIDAGEPNPIRRVKGIDNINMELDAFNSGSSEEPA